MHRSSLQHNEWRQGGKQRSARTGTALLALECFSGREVSRGAICLETRKNGLLVGRRGAHAGQVGADERSVRCNEVSSDILGALCGLGQAASKAGREGRGGRGGRGRRRGRVRLGAHGECTDSDEDEGFCGGEHCSTQDGTMSDRQGI